MADEIDTTNKYLVGVQGNDVRIMLPPMGRVSKADALLLAAWLVAIADDDDKFPTVLDAVQNT